MKFWLHTYGCQMNVRDSEAMESLLLGAGHQKALSESDADLVIINSCTVRQKAEDKALGKAGYLLSTGKKVGIAGCAVARLGDDIFKKLPRLDFAVKPGEFTKIKYLASSNDPLAEHPPTDAFSAFVTVMTGCNNFCSYCIVPKVRGPEKSRPFDDIVQEVEHLASTGIKEVTLLGQSVLKYPNFPQLLRRLQQIDKLKRIRFTSAHPGGCTDELLKAYNECDKVCRHIHLPVQSGSNKILSQMGRRYTREQYLEAIAKLRAFDDTFAITTDVIVGYPGETEEDFEETRSLMNEALFDNSFIFKYSPRPGTRSAELADDVTNEEKQRRNAVLLDDQEKRGLARNLALVGSVREVLVEGESKRNKTRLSGRDSGNRIVIWPKCENLPEKGSFVNVKILDAHAQTLFGELA
ncbi:MAG: tRNA (N6-isopentenyl adenosine(37)-C2)-methylthiotransferase MiaB [Kiritimatiellae bacterium]|nr:tRNA (N6-isopentenyl adenosine(37)-C2)-methylthiotransferase MiaB [Kiritimatiellia bacterium]